jgi:hypothetical protein
VALPQDSRPLIKGTKYEIENDLSILADEIHRILFPPKQARILKLGKKTKKPSMGTELKETERNVTQIAKGNMNFQVAGDFYNTTKPPSKKILPPPNSIGADPLLRQRIQTLFNKVGEEREKRFPGKGYFSLPTKFKHDFGIKNNKWTVIWTYPIECAPEIIEYLENTYANTIQGRKEKAWARGNRIPPRNILYAKESELLSQLGLTTKSKEVKDMLSLFFGVMNHAHLTENQHWQFVKYLENIVKGNFD